MHSRFSVLVAASLLALSACRKSDENALEMPAEETTAVANPVDAATAADITGVVKFEGTLPPPQKITMASDAACAAQHKGDIMATDVVANPNGTLSWVYVYVKSGLGDLKFPIPAPAVLDQVGCLYHPHVLAVQAGQKISIKNSDPVLHNVHAAPKNNPGFNIGQPVKGMVTEKSFANPEVCIPVKCDVHPWMLSWIGVQPHPFASVTDDKGAFSLNGLPPGTYEIEAWHEKFGVMTQKVTVGPKEKKTIEFVFKAS